MYHEGGGLDGHQQQAAEQVHDQQRHQDGCAAPASWHTSWLLCAQMMTCKLLL